MANLDQSILAQLADIRNGAKLIDGRYYQTVYEGGGMNGGMGDSGGGYDPGTLARILSYEQGASGEQGSYFDVYDPSGGYTGTRQMDHDTFGSMAKDVYTNPGFLMMVGAGLGMAGGMAGTAASSATGMTGGTAAAGAGGAGLGGMEALNGADMMSDAFVANGGYGAGGFGGGTGSLGSAIGNGSVFGDMPSMGGGGLTDAIKTGASSLMPSGGGSGLGGLAASALGALGGSQSTGGGTTSQTQRMDPRMDPYIHGDANHGGLLQHAYNTMTNQMQPGALAGYDQMRTQGQGLLQQPVRGNGFNLFTGK